MPSVDETHSPARAYDVDKPSHEPCHFSLSFQVESCAISVFIFSSSLLPFLRAHFSTSYVSHNSFSATFRFVREKGVSERGKKLCGKTFHLHSMPGNVSISTNTRHKSTTIFLTPITQSVFSFSIHSPSSLFIFAPLAYFRSCLHAYVGCLRSFFYQFFTSHYLANISYSLSAVSYAYF